ncbi:hypothetical protein NM208_g88 [Fusarium decemcellulare]|uniref:Uncharacterized protein n=1 Tax=Fusarium decemcellulare TaxID=57161 RepID=A0ACC1T0P4_9HYPO|nr:hypothetical protein NM208_g88 [Fusarium decemcellulare]
MQPAKGPNQLAIRCDREKPTCSDCVCRGEACVYPESRKKRKRPRLTNRRSQAAPSNAALTVLFERLEEIEKKCSGLAVATSPETRTHSAPTAEILSRLEGHSIVSPAGSAESPYERATILSTTPSSGIETSTEISDAADSGCCSGSSPAEDVLVALKRGLDHVVHLRRQRMNEQMTSHDDPIDPKLAKFFLDKFCTNYQLDIFQDFINMKLMYHLPEIIHMPEVSVDPSSIALYHTMLYHGCLVSSSDLPDKDESLTQRIFLRCLRVMRKWQQHATGTRTDLVAAILLMRAASQQGEIELSWQVYKLVCQYVQNLDMHNIDGEMSKTTVDPSLLQPDKADQQRKGLWALVLMDLFFRLFHDKPAMMSSNLSEWRVNMPWLNNGPDATEHVVPTLAFLVKSRLTFLLFRFCDIMDEDADGKNDAIQERTQEVCKEVEELMNEWSLEDSVKEYEGSIAHWWILYDVTLTGCCSILFMLCKTAALGSTQPTKFIAGEDVPINGLSVGISRRVLQLARLSLSKYPNPENAYSVFGAFRCYIAYGCLVKNLLTESGPLDSTLESDLVVLEQVAQSITAIAEADKDLMPLAQTLHQTIAGLRAKWTETPSVAS